MFIQFLAERLRVTNTHILAHRPLHVAAMGVRRAKARDSAMRRELLWALPSLARRQCTIPFSPDTKKAAWKPHPASYTTLWHGPPRSTLTCVRRLVASTMAKTIGPHSLLSKSPISEPSLK